MYRMFNVRSSPSPALIYSRAFPCTLLRTFSVTTMHAMLYVCSPRDLPPISPDSLFSTLGSTRTRSTSR